MKELEHLIKWQKQIEERLKELRYPPGIRKGSELWIRRWKR